MSRDGAKTWWGVDLPKEIAYLYHTGGSMWPGGKREWIKVTYSEILDKKIQNQKWELARKLISGCTVPCFVWVFRVDWFLFGGWWIYIKTVRHGSFGINFRHDRNPELVRKAMELFPCGVLPLEENFDTWAPRFAKSHPHIGFKRKRNQGLARCYVRINEGGKPADIFLK